MLQGRSFYGKVIFSSSKLLDENADNITVIINTEFYREIALQLRSLGFADIYSNEYKNADEPIPETALTDTHFLVRKYNVLQELDIEECIALFDPQSKELYKNIIEKYRTANMDFSDLASQEPMYFNDILTLTENEVFADCGVYDGRNIVDFIFETNGKYKAVYGFEPDNTNYALLQRCFGDMDKIQLLNTAVGNVNGEISFDMRGTMSSKIVQNASDKNLTKVNIMKLDTMKIPPTLIKMDIEGGEYDALLGAERIITETKPKLVISVYHCDDDLYRLPMVIHKFRPDYKFYLRHHTNAYVDTVLYAY